MRQFLKSEVPLYRRDTGPSTPRPACPAAREFFSDNQLVRNHFFIEIIWWTGLAPWEIEFPFPGSSTSGWPSTPRPACPAKREGEVDQVSPPLSIRPPLADHLPAAPPPNAKGAWLQGDARDSQPPPLSGFPNFAGLGAGLCAKRFAPGDDADRRVMTHKKSPPPRTI